VPSSKTSIQNRKYQSSPGDWSKTGWSCLRFTMNDPQYFMYTYTASGTTGQALDTFTAMANGDLDGDGNLSSFQFFGQIQALSGENVLTMAATIQETAAEE
jgi:type IV pilus assembly protein PilA